MRGIQSVLLFSFLAYVLGQVTPFSLLSAQIAAFSKNPEDDFVGVVKGRGQKATASTPAKPSEQGTSASSSSLPGAPAPASSSSHESEVRTDPNAASTTSTSTNTGNGDSTQPVAAAAPAVVSSAPAPPAPPTDTAPAPAPVAASPATPATTSNTPATTSAPAETTKEETTSADKDKGTQHKGSHILEKLEDLKKRVEKLESSGYGGGGDHSGVSGGGGGGGGYGSGSTSSDTVQTANGPVSKVYDPNAGGLPHPGQVIGVSSFGVANPLVGIGKPDPDNKRKYNSVDVGKAKNLDHKAAVAGQAVAEQADQAHKDFLDENTEEFERVMSWLQQQQQLSPSQKPPQLIFQILKARIADQEAQIRASLSNNQGTSLNKNDVNGGRTTVIS